MLFRASTIRETARHACRTPARRWRTGTARTFPAKPVFAAFAADLKAAQKTSARSAEIGKRVNYELPGARSKFMKTGREVEKLEAGPTRRPS